MTIINICHDCLTGMKGDVFFKTEKNNVFICEKCDHDKENKYLNVSLEDAIKVRDEYLSYINKVKFTDYSKNKIREILDSKIKEYN